MSGHSAQLTELFFLVCEEVSLLSAVLQQYISILKQQAATSEPSSSVDMYDFCECYYCHEDVFFHLTEQQQHRWTTSFSNMLKVRRATLRESDKNNSSVEKASSDAIFWTMDWEIERENEYGLNNCVNFPCSQVVNYLTSADTPSFPFNEILQLKILDLYNVCTYLPPQSQRGRWGNDKLNPVSSVSRCQQPI